MKNISIRLKITLWFSVALVLIVALSFVVILSVSGSVLQKTIRDSLIDTIENNVDEVEFLDVVDYFENDNDDDHYISFNGGYLEVDDDYLDLVNGVATALYMQNGTLMYGENPIAKNTVGTPFVDGEIQRVSVSGVTYYIYDRQLTLDGLEGLWLRGTVSEKQGSAQLSSIVGLSLYVLPVLVALAVLGGYIIAGRTLKPIRKIEEAAAQISHDKNLKKRIELAPGTDELHNLANTFNEMFERLDEAFESERRFASDVSHELRTPVSVIMAQCEYSLEATRTSEEYESALSIIQKQGGKMSRIIGTMLDFIRLERKLDSYSKDTLDLSLLVSSVCEDMALLCEQNIKMTFEVEPDIMVIGNTELLMRLLTNLISNAYRYGRENGNIKVELKRAEQEIHLSVMDDGIGIAPDQQKRIFGRFYQVESSRNGKGTGLGLAMVSEIAHFHQGEIKVESELGKGSVFTLILKIAK